MEESMPGVQEATWKRWVRKSPSEVTPLCLVEVRGQPHPNSLQDSALIFWLTTLTGLTADDDMLQVHDSTLTSPDWQSPWPIRTKGRDSQISWYPKERIRKPKAVEADPGRKAEILYFYFIYFLNAILLIFCRDILYNADDIFLR